VTIWWDDLRIGTVLELGSRSVDAAEIIEFARRYDPQPFHLDESAAAQSSFGGLVASGVHTFGIFTALAAGAFFTRIANLGGTGITDMRWLVPVRPGDTLSARAEILSQTRPSASKPDRGVLVLRAELANQCDELVWHATVTSLVRRRPAAAGG